MQKKNFKFKKQKKNKKKNSHIRQHLVSMVGAALVQSNVLPKTAGNFKQSTQVNCHGEFATDLWITHLVIYGTQNFQVKQFGNSLTFRNILKVTYNIFIKKDSEQHFGLALNLTTY